MYLLIITFTKSDIIVSGNGDRLTNCFSCQTNTDRALSRDGAVETTCAQDPKDEGDKLLDFAKEETDNDKKISGEAEDEEEAGKMKWKDSLKIRRGKLKKLSLDESTDEGQQS